MDNRFPTQKPNSLLENELGIIVAFLYFGKKNKLMKRLPRDAKEKKEEKKKLNSFFEVVFFVHSLFSLFYVMPHLIDPQQIVDSAHPILKEIDNEKNIFRRRK